MHKDTWGIILIIIVLFGAFYGRGLPALIPQILLFTSIGLLLYRGFFIKSKYALLYTASIWVCISWLAGKSLEEAWGDGFLMKVSVIITPGKNSEMEKVNNSHFPTFSDIAVLEKGVRIQKELIFLVVTKTGLTIAKLLKE